jgi:hypothetical protein
LLYRDKRVVGVFVRFSCAASLDMKGRLSLTQTVPNLKLLTTSRCRCSPLPMPGSDRSPFEDGRMIK